MTDGEDLPPQLPERVYRQQMSEVEVSLLLGRK